MPFIPRPPGKIEHVYLECEPAARRYLEALEEAGVRFTDKSVLDAGCGTGLYTRLIAARGAAKVLGVDVTPRNIELAEKNKPSSRVTYRCVDLEHFVSPETFDSIFARGVVYYCKDLKRMIRCLAGLAKPGGELIVTFTERTFGALLGNVIKKIAAKLPKAIRPACRDVLAAIYYLSTVAGQGNGQGWPVIKSKMNTIFFPAEHLLTSESAKSVLTANGFEIIRILPRPGKWQGSSDFAIWARRCF